MNTSSLRAFTLLELLVAIAITGLLAAFLMPALGRARSKALNAVCVGQLQQLGVAVRVYADENQNLLPTAELLPSMPVDPAAPKPRICDVLRPYLSKTLITNTSPAIFKCPSDAAGRFTTEGSSYQWNTSLNGRRLDETITANLTFSSGWEDPGGERWQTNGILQRRSPPVAIPLFNDYDDFHPRPPKSGKNVVFMDNHVTPLEVPVPKP